MPAAPTRARWYPATRIWTKHIQIYRNIAPNEFRVGSFTDALDSLTSTAVTDWNNALRSSPNSLTKYPLHCCYTDDGANANVQVWGFTGAEFDGHCGTEAIACVEDDLTPGDTSWDAYRLPQYVIVDLNFGATRDTLNHELGHVVAILNEHYNPDGSCGYPWGTTIMDGSGCGAVAPTEHDEDDFWDLLKPQEIPNPTTMTINSSSSVTFGWSSSAGVRHNVSKFYLPRKTDTNGTVIDWLYPDRSASTQPYTNIGTPSRWCVTAQGYSEAGFKSLNPWTGASYHGCISRFKGDAGNFLATTQREYGLRVRVRNNSGGSRYIWALGPGLQNIGCTEQLIANGGTYNCLASVSIGQYDALLITARTSTNLKSSGAVDFD